uniref:Uncharacterized protein n=1 Tax=Bracon brevicornis TaxID=1563983 RepID=A0A6V7HYA2_9HYME
MYAAAGGASIANRRKQKRLQLNKQRVPEVPVPIIKKIQPTSQHIINKASLGRHQHQHHHHHYHHHQQQQEQQQQQHQQQQSLVTTSSSLHCNHAHGHNRRKKNDRLALPNRLAPPVSPIFPISPPPLSLESQNSATLLPPLLKSSNFPFPPPSFLDLRSSSSSELQVGIKMTI